MEQRQNPGANTQKCSSLSNNISSTQKCVRKSFSSFPCTCVRRCFGQMIPIIIIIIQKKQSRKKSWIIIPTFMHIKNTPTQTNTQKETMKKLIIRNRLLQSNLAIHSHKRVFKKTKQRKTSPISLFSCFAFVLEEMGRI